MRVLFFILFTILLLVSLPLVFLFTAEKQQKKTVKKDAYWFILHRKSNKEVLYRGVPGDAKQSNVLKTFTVKTGMPGRPTPLPKLLGKKYWVITDKLEQKDNPETAPYFLTLNIASPFEYPYGPSPYKECNNEQCNWEVAGPFGLHGVAGNAEKLSKEDPGSSGCIRHNDHDITYLYKLLDPKKEEIRYYIEDN